MRAQYECHSMDEKSDRKQLKTEHKSTLNKNLGLRHEANVPSYFDETKKIKKMYMY